MHHLTRERSLDRSFSGAQRRGRIDVVELVQPSSAAERTFEPRLVDAIFMRGLGRRLSHGALQAIRELGLELAHGVRAPQPAQRVLDAIRIAALDLFPADAEPEAHRKLGLQLVHGFTAGWKARAALAGARAVGVERTLARLLGHHRAPSNFLAIDFKQLRPHVYEVALNLGAPHPELLVGLAQGVLEALGARGAEVALTGRGEAERLEVHLSGR